jgi:hypothetical protein
MKTNKTAARTFGFFFLIAFLSYGLGSGLIESIVNVPDFLSNIPENKATIIIGVILIAIIHTIVNIGLAVIMLPILMPFNKTLSYGYLSAAITASVLLVVGAIFLLLLIPLSNVYVKLGATGTSNFETVGLILKKGGYFSYQIGMTIWGFGGLLFCSLLHQSKLVPRLVSIWGFIGYLIFISGTIFELFGYNVGVILSIPGGLFEIYLSIWLIIKGFNESNSYLILKYPNKI